MQLDLAMVALFSAATVVALIARRVRIPYTVALVLAGVGLGAVHAFEPPHLTKELLYGVFLPGLLFEAAFALELGELWRNKLTIFSLALPGLVVAILLTATLLVPVAAALHVGQGFSFTSGLVFASLIAATDPIAVVALFKSLGVPERLGVLVEGESLLNDGTTIAVFMLVLSALAGGQLAIGEAAIEFARNVGLGVLVGCAVALLASEVIRRIDDAMTEITLTTVAAYGSFVAAEHLGCSGVIAMVSAGVLCGNYGARAGMSPSTRVAVAAFWEYLAFALNSVVFLLIGFTVRVSALLEAWQPILVAYLAVTLGRALVTHAVAAALRRGRERIPMRWATVLAWGGLRGGLSMVLVLGLPADLPHRDLLATMTFGVVIVSILLQGTTMGPLLRRLGLVTVHEARRNYERLMGEARAARAALREIERAVADGTSTREGAEPLQADYARRLARVESELQALAQRTTGLQREERETLRRRALAAEKDAIGTAYRGGQLSAETYDRLQAEVNDRLLEPPADD